MRLFKCLIVAALALAPLSIVDAQSAGWLPLASRGASPTVYAGGTSAVTPGFPAGAWTSAAVDLGPVTATRYITVMIMSGGAGSSPPQASTSVTLGTVGGGATMTKILTSDDGTFFNDVVELWAVQGATAQGSSATVTIQPACSFCVQPAGVSVVVFDHITTTISSSNFANLDGTPPSPASVGSITVPASGVAGFYAFSANTSTPNSWSGTGVSTGTTDNTAGGTMSNGISSTAGAVNAQLTSLGFVTRHMIAVAFGP